MQNIIALEQPLDLGDALREGAEDQGAMGDGLVARRPQAAAELGVSSVPALVINGAVVSGLQDYTAYQTAIGQAWIDIE